MRLLTIIVILIGCIFSFSCTENNQNKYSKVGLDSSKDIKLEQSADPHSYANAQQIQTKHISLDLTADFANKRLHGSAVLELRYLDDQAKRLVLDTRDLIIERVDSNHGEAEYSLGEQDEYLGAPLTINLPVKSEWVKIYYETKPSASGLQWLTPEQTAGKKHPYLFTQAQAIHARSFIPLQDSPQVRVTYDAKITTDKALRAVMSASNSSKENTSGIYTFSMPQPIPSYLIALAIGDIQFKAMGQRTGVYAEVEYLEKAAKEFEDTELMLEKTEQQYGDYSWGRYDLLILPPSFPFGGMENPRLSFITPTVLAGDKSLVSLIAHELAHSWSGNTVTNATWRDLWLNEGFTTYLTYRIMELIYGERRYNMEAVLGYQDLMRDLDTLPDKDQILAIDLQGRHPDDVFSNIPYEKGALFLREIEQKIGRTNFDAFLTSYFEHFAFQSITTAEFIEYLKKTLLAEYSSELDENRIYEWIYEPGLPEGAPTPHSDVFTNIDDIRAKWLLDNISAADIDTSDWTVHEWLYFLNKMPNEISQSKLIELNESMQLTQSSNNEIVHSWLLIAIKNNFQPAYDRLYEYLISIGRNKLVKPLYRELSKTPEGKAFARKAFMQAKSSYHPLTVTANEGFIE